MTFSVGSSVQICSVELGNYIKQTILSYTVSFIYMQQKHL